MSFTPRLRRLNPKGTLMFVCDIQEGFRKAMPLYPALISNTMKLLKGMALFDIPILATEQYPDKLGPTVKELKIKNTACAVIAKTRFSMMVPEIDEIIRKLSDQPPKDVLIAGLETHVCVEQTCADLLRNRVRVWVAADCVCSRTNQDRDIALQRLRDAGCFVTTSESILFNLLCDKNHEKFNEVVKLIREPSCDMELSSVGKREDANEKN